MPGDLVLRPNLTGGEVIDARQAPRLAEPDSSCNRQKVGLIGARINEVHTNLDVNGTSVVAQV